MTSKVTSFLDRVAPNRPRSKQWQWPFQVEDGEPPMLTMRILGQHELEEAYFETVDHFKAQKRGKVDPADGAFLLREHAALIWRAFRTPEGAALALSTDEIAEQPLDINDVLYAAWSSFQSEVAAKPPNPEAIKVLVEELKKKPHSVPLTALSSSTLIACITSLVSQPETSMLPSEVGSQP